MRNGLAAFLALMLCASAALAVEKAPDLVDATPQAGFLSVMQGTLTAGSPTYDRAYGDEVSLDCGAPFIDSANDGMHLEIFCIKSTDSRPIELVVDAAGTDIIDTVLTIYCRNWDPTTPLSYAIAFDDDGGDGTLSAITGDDGVILDPGQTYWAVLSTFGAGMTGNFLIQASGNLVSCDAVPVTASSWGTLKAVYR